MEFFVQQSCLSFDKQQLLCIIEMFPVQVPWGLNDNERVLSVYEIKTISSLELTWTNY